MDHYKIPEKTMKYMHHDMIERYTTLPEFPYGRTRLLHAFLEEGEPGKPHDNDLYAIVTSLVQLGMDTHDEVDLEDTPEHLAMTRQKQLRVLAGDFFSARFYHLLSQYGKIDLIRSLSNAICEINRLKLNLYQKMNQVRVSAEDYVQHLVHIKSELFSSFTYLMAEKYKEKWPSVLQAFTRCEVLLEEMGRLNDKNSFRGSWGFWYLLEVAQPHEIRLLKSGNCKTADIRLLAEKYHLHSTITSMLDEQFQKVYTGIQYFRSSKLMKELQHIGEKFRQFLPGSKALEELLQ